MNAMNAVNNGHLCVIDGSNMIHRAWAMGKPRQREHDGMEVGATWLFTQMIVKLLRRMNDGNLTPTHVAIFFDPARENIWRRDILATYKAHRPDMDPLFAAQIPLMKEFCAAIGLAEETAPRHEADDMIGAYTEVAAARGDRVSIVSTDKDLMQLVRPRVMQVNPVTNVWFNEARVVDKFEVPVALIGDYLALAGDSSDGVPGAPGIGAKSASALLNDFGGLEEILNRTEEIEKKSWRRIIGENVEQIKLSRRLVALDSFGVERALSDADMIAPVYTFPDTAEAWRLSELT
jgi:DNA polymerase-1